MEVFLHKDNKFYTKNQNGVLSKMHESTIENILITHFKDLNRTPSSLNTDLTFNLGLEIYKVPKSDLNHLLVTSDSVDELYRGIKEIINEINEWRRNLIYDRGTLIFDDLKFVPVNIIKGQYVDIYDDGTEIKTDCRFDKINKVVIDVESAKLDGGKKGRVELVDGTIHWDYILEGEQFYDGMKVND